MPINLKNDDFKNLNQLCKGMKEQIQNGSFTKIQWKAIATYFSKLYLMTHAKFKQIEEGEIETARQMRIIDAKEKNE